LNKLPEAMDALLHDYKHKRLGCSHLSSPYFLPRFGRESKFLSLSFGRTTLQRDVNVTVCGEGPRNDLKAKPMAVMWQSGLSEFAKNELVGRKAVLVRLEYLCAGYKGCTDGKADTKRLCPVSLLVPPPPSLSPSLAAFKSAQKASNGTFAACPVDDSSISSGSSNKIEVHADDLSTFKMYKKGDHPDPPPGIPLNSSHRIQNYVKVQATLESATAMTVAKSTLTTSPSPSPIFYLSIFSRNSSQPSPLQLFIVGQHLLADSDPLYSFLAFFFFSRSQRLPAVQHCARGKKADHGSDRQLPARGKGKGPPPQEHICGPAPLRRAERRQGTSLLLSWSRGRKWLDIGFPFALLAWVGAPLSAVRQEHHPI
jgi:hypothetical protein